MSRDNVGSNEYATADADRRDVSVPRIQYEALVEVGARSIGGFEAESIDVSADGIRLRTAYLPNVGERLVCRFDGPGGEIVAEGDVIWCREEGRGGQIGLRFVGLDERGAKLLASLCGPPEPIERGEASLPDAFIGSRVKLHIEGLGSPMRARVKDATHGEILVGSSLEFLRVGRDIELEDVEHGGRRAAMIEHVGVEIDSENSVPQLVVALRYDEGVEEEASERAQPPSFELRPAMVPAAGKRGGAEKTPEPTVVDNDGVSIGSGSVPQVAAAAGIQEMPAIQSAQASLPVQAIRHNSEVADNAQRLNAVSRGFGTLAGRIRPKLKSAGNNARNALGTMVAALKRREAGSRLPQSPMRTTAPPPSGALRNDGRRLVREKADMSAEGETGQAEMPARSYKRRAAVWTALGAVAVVAAYTAITRLPSFKSHRPAVAIVDAQAAASNPGPQPPAPGGPIATADVPLFGATPLSTTEPVPAPPNVESMPQDEEESKSGSSQPDNGKNAARLQKEWGVGQMSDPIVMKLTMDGDIAGISGSEGQSGFTLVIPGRKSLTSAAGLARKDKRIESVNVVNFPDRAEVTFRFKGDAPAYLAKANGKRLLIEIDGKHKKAKSEGSATGPSKKKGAAAGHGRANEKRRKHSGSR